MLNNEVSREKFFERKGFRIISAIVLQRKMNGDALQAHTERGSEWAEEVAVESWQISW